MPSREFALQEFFFKKTYINKLVFHVTVQLLPFSMDVSQPYNK